MNYKISKNGSLAFELPKLHAGQQQVLNSTKKYRILMCGRQWGKSFVCSVLALRSMLEGKDVAYITHKFQLSEEFFFQIQKYIPKELIADCNKASLLIRLKTGGRLQFFSSGQDGSIRGRKFSRIIIDEAAHFQDLKALWGFEIIPTLATTSGDVLVVSTPNGLDMFNELFERGLDPDYPNYESFHFPSQSSPFVGKDFITEFRQDHTEDEYRQEILAEPLASTGNPFGMEHINKNTIQELSTNPTFVYGIDIAKSNDYTVIIGLDLEGSMTYFDRYRGEWSLTKQKIKDLPSSILKAMDATSMGDVLYEELAPIVPNLRGFVFTGKSKPILMQQLIYDVQKGNLKFNQMTALEMKAFEKTETASGNFKFAAKSGRHDDAVCALAMANKYLKEATYAKDWRLYSL